MAERPKKVVVVGLGMKLLKYDARAREYNITVLGEESHLAYNRVGLTSFFEHRKVENLHLNPAEWYTSASKDALGCHINTEVVDINSEQKTVSCANGNVVPYDVLVLATGSDALLPRHTPGHDASGVFVYRTIDDLISLIEFADAKKGTVGTVVGGGLLGLEAAKAMMDLGSFAKVKLAERNRWILSRQLDEDAGSMVVQQVNDLGLDVMLGKRVQRIKVDEKNSVTGVVSGLKCAERGGGIIVSDHLATSHPDIYAIGECASWKSQTFGLIAPGVEMADVLAFILTQAKLHSPRTFKRPDLSTKLKLLGVDVASFGDFFADRDGRQPSCRPGDTCRQRFDSGVMQAFCRVPVQEPLHMPRREMPWPTEDYVKVICSCHNVTKRDVVNRVKDGSCKDIGAIKSCTKAGTGCGGCMPLVTTIFKKTMATLGNEVKNHLCSHFSFSRADLYNIIMVKRLQTLAEVMREAGNDKDSSGCELCKPAVGSILASLWNKHVMEKPTHGLQDTNDRFLGNIQQNGTYSVVPRVPGGEITPDKLVAIGEVAKKFGIGDSVGMAVRLEERYKSIRAPHKIKGGASGCVRECAEAQSKDFGLIATEQGFNVFVAGNGGAKPRHAELLAKDVPPADVVPILDRYLMFYIRTADKLQRTAPWVESLPGGIKYLQEVVLEDKLGICASLESQMQELVGSFFDEWAEAIRSPAIAAKFKQFQNTDASRLSKRGAGAGLSSGPRTRRRRTSGACERDGSSMSWQPVIEASYLDGADELPNGVSANIKRSDTQLAVWRFRGRFYATQQMCPHKRANDAALSIATFPAQVRPDGMLYLELPPVEELDAALGTSRWLVRKGESGEPPLAELDRKIRLVGQRARKPDGVKLVGARMARPVELMLGGCGVAPEW
ncbi:Nitrite reductase [Tolypocladium capitatum]|uniref:Nitrite reductase [NAD(P)H] n=1 Tax=Tolypocladium capitatum TaxID=45235 RepID=A0A2K3QA91_9HYPO|nr:Nitrite reductase [Tolypocladium capitatum]